MPFNIFCQPSPCMDAREGTIYNGLAAWWGLDDVSDSRFDFVANLELDTIGGGTVDYDNGLIGFCATFNNSAALSGSLDFLDTTKPYSFSLWIKPSNSGQVWEDSAVKLGISCDVDNGLLTIQGFGNYSQASVGLDNGDWVHVVVIFENNLLTGFYVNGQPTEITYAEEIFPPHLTGESFALGYDHTDGVPAYSGLIDEMVFWNRALLPSEVAVLYNNGNGKAYRGQ